LKKKFKILFFILFIFNNIALAQISEANLRANWVYLIAEKMEWEDKVIDNYTIGVYGENPTELEFLKELAITKTIKSKTTEIIHIAKLKNITKTDILFVEEKENDNIELIYNKIKNTNTLLITYKCTNSQFIMVNLLLEGIKKQFEINSSNLATEKIIVDDKLMALGGTKIDLQGLFEKKVAELTEKERQLTEKEKLLTEKESELELQKTENLNQKNENIKQKEENERQKDQNRQQTLRLEQKEIELYVEKNKAADLFREIQKQKIVLNQSQLQLTEKELQIQIKQNEILKRDSALEHQNEELNKKEIEVQKREAKINEQSSQIENQKLVIFGIVSFVVLLLGLGFVIWRGYRINKRINNELNKKNNEIVAQKEEIENKSHQLTEINVELEKLSIVASKTQNAISILDKQGNFEWVNYGFTKLYGYTLQLLINELDENVKNVSANTEIEEILRRCAENKETVTYESINTTRNGEKIWVQTTLTPILDNDDNVSKIVAIDAEINKLKEQEREIRQKNEELHQQKDEMFEQKEEIEMKSKLINSSINYAKTIQNTILPLISKINLFFESYVIYKPKDIVSGDFYWFVKISDFEFYAAAVDCTGHGVPGAFMSLIGSRILSNIVQEKNVRDPKNILEMLNKEVIKALKQEETTNNDGMDLCFCKIIKTKINDFEITFTGAKRPLFYYQKSENKIETLKADRKSIGGVRKKNEINFTNQIIYLAKNDSIYLSTDGIIDQNAEDRKRFGTSSFLRLLEEIKDFEFEKQKEVIENTLTNFKKQEEQRDDITLFALRMI